MHRVRVIAMFVGPLLAVAVWLLCKHRFDLPELAAVTAGVTTLCAVWWVFEPIPIPATSLIPLALLPTFGVLTYAQVGQSYGDKLVLLLMGGSILSASMEKCGVHRRLALGMVRAVGGRGGRRLVLGFMLASAVLSMWISNTATTFMLLPMALAVLHDNDDPRLATPLLLGLAYGASIGGLGTPIGTPPNLVFMNAWNAHRETIGEPAWHFVDWMQIGMPVVAVMLPIAWLWITRGMGKPRAITLPAMGRWRAAERRVLIVFGLTAMAWVFRKYPFGGWSELLGVPQIDDSSIALIGCVIMFIVPDGEGGRLLDWPAATRIPWGLMILFGGGVAIATAFKESGLNDAIGAAMAGIENLPVWLMILTLCLCVTFLTEVTSNTATAVLLIPIMLAAGIEAGINPALLMIPAALSASCAFMLPVATPPNAIVYGAERFTVRRMAREGLAINLAGAVVITVLMLVLL